MNNDEKYIFEIAGDADKCGSGGNGKSDLLARAEAAEARAKKAETERDAVLKLCWKLIVLCSPPRELEPNWRKYYEPIQHD